MEFFKSGVDLLQLGVTAMGGGAVLMGLLNIFESLSSDNPRSACAGYASGVWRRRDRADRHHARPDAQDHALLKATVAGFPHGGEPVSFWKGEISLNFLWMKISEWLKELLVAGIIGNLSGLFDGINDKVAQITDVVGMTPQQWNGGVFSMVKNLSETVVTPIAGIILTAVACIELLSMMIERNNMRDFDLFEVFKWLMKTTFAVMIVSNTWTIVMGVFEATQSVVNRAAGVVVVDTSIHLEEIVVNLEQRLMEMEVGPLFGLFIQSVLMQIISWLLTISIFVIVYGRMIEIYLVTSLAPVPLATMVNREWGQIGQGYLKSLFALGFQAVLMIICVAIYAVLVRSIAVETDVVKAIWTAVGYTVLLCFCLFKTSSLSRSILGAH